MAAPPRGTVTNELLFETLKAMHGTLARHSEDLREIKERLGMTTVIKNGTIVTADLTYKADLIEGGKIAEIGKDLKGDEELDATGCYVMPGGIDPHVHLEMPFMGTYSSDDFESGTRAACPAAPRWWSISRCPTRAKACSRRCSAGTTSRSRAHCDYSFHMAITWWGEQVFERDGGPWYRTRHQHLQAFHGLQGRADGG
jgi:dihydroorotase-like cyclic amidohydrolase